MGQKVIVVTGGSSGIGAALTVLLAEQQNVVVPVARRAEALAEVAGRCGGQAHPVAADVTNRAEVERVVEQTLKRLGGIDVWVNNAGQGITKAPSELTDEDIDSMMTANVKSALYGMQEVLPHFKERGAGHIVNISSMLGRIPYATMRSSYCGAKHFLNALTATFRDEVQQTHPNIHVSLISPGVVYTEFGRNARHGGPDSRTFPEGQSAEEVAEVIAAVVESHASDVYTRRGYRDRVVEYYSSLGTNPS